MKKLECQLKDIAYGSRPYKIDTSKFEFVSGSGLDDTIELERGQNLLQVNISQVSMMYVPTNRPILNQLNVHRLC